jgi:pyrimidine-nucleoside phosphorylase
MNYHVPSLIAGKRDGGSLTTDQLTWMVTSYTDDDLPHYQMAAFLMAVLFQGMDDTELGAWTDAMLTSGEVLDLSGSSLQKVDKHSTGGVGDKISLPLVPLLAACGFAVPMISGRGLGHTGGTLDKLESIPGFRTELSIRELTEQVQDIGMAMAGQSEELVPADRRLYALRDATATVPSIPLIASSIMSKKLAEDLDSLTLDVKVGSGAFMKDIDDARALAATMVSIGRSYDTPVVALLTAMDQPLGAEVGNANEVAESIETLRGEGPSDVIALTMALGTEMMVGCGLFAEDARSMLEKALSSGAALQKFGELIEAQGGDPAVIDNPSLLPAAAETAVVTSPVEGFVTRCDALTVGQAAVRLGAGRAAKEDAIDHGVGITLHAKVGDEVIAGAPLATVRYHSRNRLEACLAELDTAWSFADERPEPEPLILGEVR